jgi:hypothetical protein
MFDFLTRKKERDGLERCVRRLRDLTIPNYGSEELGARRSTRHNRVIPTLLCPFEDQRPLIDEHTFAITRDFSDNGVSLVLSQPARIDQVLLGFWVPHPGMVEPSYVLGTVERQAAIGGGFWLLGVDFVDVGIKVCASSLPALRPLASRLLPPGWGAE